MTAGETATSFRFQHVSKSYKLAGARPECALGGINAYRHLWKSSGAHGAEPQDVAVTLRGAQTVEARHFSDKAPPNFRRNPHAIADKAAESRWL